MKAARVKAFGEDLAAIAVEDVAVAEPGPGQVRVRMLYSPVNPSDFNFIHGTYHQALSRCIWNRGQATVTFDPARVTPCPVPPYTLGGEGVGIVEACGSGLLAKRLRGKRVAVAAGPPQGTWQESTIAEAKKCVVLPSSVDDRQASMFFVNPLSAYVMVREVLRVEPGAWLLQTAAGSALGKGVVRMARRDGFKTICVVRSNANSDELRRLGADAVIETDSQDLLDEIARITGGKGVRYALDCVGGELAESVVRCLGLGGKMLVYGTLARAPIRLPSRDLMMPVAQISGFFVSNWLQGKSPLKLLGVLRNVKKLVADGVFDTEVTEEFGLDDIHAALAAANRPGRTGKVLLKFS